MKKTKPLSLNPISTNTQSKSNKKSTNPANKKSQQSSTIPFKKSLQPKTQLKKEPQDFIIINDHIYSANTFTERNSYENFLFKVKKQKQVERKSFLLKSQLNDDSQLKKSKQNAKISKFKKLSPKDFLQTMSLEQKKEMFFKLQQQIKNANGITELQNVDFITKNSQPCSTQSFENDITQRERKQKFSQIEQKLENVKMQLILKWQGQLEKIDQLYRQGKLSEVQKEQKTQIIKKLKDHKMKALDCTKNLLEKILKEEQFQNEQDEQKTDKIEAILQSLHSFPSLESMEGYQDQKEHNLKLKPKSNQILGQNSSYMTMHKLNDAKIIKSLQSSPLEVEEQNHEAFQNQFTGNQSNREKIQRRQPVNQQFNIQSYQNKKEAFVKFQEMAQTKKELFDIPTKSAQVLKQLLQGTFEQISIFPQNQQSLGNTHKLALKIDLRVDEVVFGKNQYPQEDQNVNQHEVIQQDFKFVQTLVEQVNINEALNRKNVLLYYPQENSFQKQILIKDLKISLQDKQSQNLSNKIIQSPKIETKNSSRLQEPLEILTKSPKIVSKISLAKAVPPKQAETVDQQVDLSCNQLKEQRMNINIPMLLSKEKMETLAVEQNRTFRENIDKRIAFQMGCLEIQPSSSNSPHFTTLVDINSYIVGFYEFMMKKYMNLLVDNLNIPYGKSAVDKLFSLHTEGFVLEETYNQMNNILGDSHFLEYQREMTLTIRKSSQFQIAHNRAVFNAFTKCINVYRPYYELQGQVFPWIVSQKGITFYQITEDNIEQVFEKSKIKVLENCTALCGLHPPSEVKNEEQVMIVKNKNEENMKKMVKSEIVQNFDEWKIRYVNFDCLVKMCLGKMISDELFGEYIKEIKQISNKNYET